jgi:hypothetical protein
MKASFVILIFCMLGAESRFSRGSEPGPPMSLFALPKIELRKEAEAQGAAPGSKTKSASAAEEVEELTVSAEGNTMGSETSVQVFEAMNGGLVLSRVEMPDEPAGAIGWVETKIWDPVFAPELVKLGKVQVSGGVVAAIKRKNPFCLLNPLVFVASW